jgi:hypothetical protein
MKNNLKNSEVEEPTFSERFEALELRVSKIEAELALRR